LQWAFDAALGFSRGGFGLDQPKWIMPSWGMQVKPHLECAGDKWQNSGDAINSGDALLTAGGVWLMVLGGLA